MRLLIQRVLWARVEVQGRNVGHIENGLLIYVGVAAGDLARPAQWLPLADKVAQLRIFEDDAGKMNLNVQDRTGGAVLVVPNFTLLADARKGRRPSFDAAAPADEGQQVLDQFVQALKAAGLDVAQGQFGADMLIENEADGPVNVIIDSPSPDALAHSEAPPPMAGNP
ncbi:MAG: D-tyrosyl-tRNA(Tyr) deacylase [Planctomycetaceae bacterium]|nr:D-tyrosyl-tRNA(Tyr) deacylase [Planctomycetaceae bacterium]